MLETAIRCCCMPVFENFRIYFPSKTGRKWSLRDILEVKHWAISSGWVVYTWSINVAVLPVILVGLDTSCDKSNRLIRFSHLLFVRAFRSLLKSPMRSTSRPDDFTMENSSSKTSIHSFNALGGLLTVHNRKGLAFGRSI